jgi:hypothetical protein
LQRRLCSSTQTPAPLEVLCSCDAGFSSPRLLRSPLHLVAVACPPESKTADLHSLPPARLPSFLRPSPYYCPGRPKK